MAPKSLIFFIQIIFINPEDNIIIKNEKDIKKNNCSVCWKLKKSEVFLNNSISYILLGLLTKDIKGTIVPIVKKSKSEFVKITNIIKINFFLVCIFKYETNFNTFSNILIKFLDFQFYIYFK